MAGIEKTKKKKYVFFIGIDVSKNELDYAVMQENRVLFHQEGKNNPDDVTAFCGKLKGIPGFRMSKALFCMEQTGFYGNPSLIALRKLKASVVCENPVQIRRSLGLLRGKDDKADAMRIATYAQRNREHLRLWEPRRLIIDELMYLNTLRNRLLVMSMMVSNPLKEQGGFIIRGLQKKLTSSCKNTAEAVASDLEGIDGAMEQLIKCDARLNRLQEIIISVKSVGKITAIQMILSTNEFRDIACPKKFACYAGVAPFKKESGVRINKPRISGFANQKMKSLLHICALNAIRCDEELKAYYEKKTKIEGKPKMAVINAVRCKLILRVFACVKQDRLFTTHYARSGRP